MELDHVAATALIDTGATVSGVGARVIQQLGLQSYGKSRLKSATEEVFVPYYLFRIGLFTTEQIESADMSAVVLPYVFEESNGFGWMHDAGFDVILGMDVLRQCDLSLSRDGVCQIRFG